MSETATPSRLITFLGRLGLACLIGMPLTVLAVRLGLHFGIGLPIFALTALLPAYRAERARALLWTLPALPPLIIFLAILLPAGNYPVIHDITTDTENPPRFDSGVHYRGEDSNPIDIKPEVIAIQKEHYPDMAPIETALSAEQAFERAAEVAESMHWNIYNSDPTNGIIEAEYTSFWFGFTDDIVIRVRRTPGGSKVDLRSVSRVGRSDLGANAARIRVLRDALVD